MHLQVQSTVSMEVASPSVNILSQSQVRATLVVLTFSSYDYQLSSCHKNYFSVSCCMLPPTCCNVCCLVQGSIDPSDSSTSTAHTGEISFCKHCCNKICTSDLLLANACFPNNQIVPSQLVLVQVTDHQVSRRHQEKSVASNRDDSRAMTAKPQKKVKYWHSFKLFDIPSQSSSSEVQRCLGHVVFSLW